MIKIHRPMIGVVAKSMLCVALVCSCFFDLRGQIAYFSGEYEDLSGVTIRYIAKVDLDGCAVEYLVLDSMIADGWDELAVCPNNKVYAFYSSVSSDGGIYEIDLEQNTYSHLQFVPIAVGPGGFTCSCDTIIYGGGGGNNARLYSYNIRTEEFEILGSLPPGLAVVGDVFFLNGELYASGAQNKIMHIDLENLDNSSVIHEPTEWQITGFTTEYVGCDSTNLFIARLSSAKEQLLTIHRMNTITFEEQPYCSVAVLGSVSGWASESCQVPDPCMIVVDLDNNNSGGLLPVDFQDSLYCPPVQVMVSDTDVVVSADKPWDSLHVTLLHPVTGDPELSGTQLPGIVISGAGTRTLVLRNTGNVPPEQLTQQIQELRLVYDPVLQNITYVVAYVAFADDIVSDTAYAYIYIGARAYHAGDNVSLFLCADVLEYDLTADIPGSADQGGYWTGSIPLDGVVSPVDLTSGAYYYVVEDPYCRPDSAEWQIEVVQDIAALGSDTMLCSGDTLTLKAPSGNDIRWQDGSKSIEQLVTETGLYWIEVNTKEGCVFTDSVFIEFSDEQVLDTSFLLCQADTVKFRGLSLYSTGLYDLFIPGDGGVCDTLWIIEVQMEPDTLQIAIQDALCDLGSVTLTAEFGSAASYLWSTGATDAHISVEEGGIYALTVSYGPHCSVIDSVEVFPCEDPRYYLPNIFSPNGDQVNDVFQVYAAELRLVKLTVYDRWGGVLYDETSLTPSWDGNVNGQRANPGVYLCYIEMMFEDGAIVVLTQDLTLVR